MNIALTQEELCNLTINDIPVLPLWKARFKEGDRVRLFQKTPWVDTYELTSSSIGDIGTIVDEEAVDGAFTIYTDGSGHVYWNICDIEKV
jgi:hypothetical protein